MPSASRVTLVTNRSSPTSWHLLPIFSRHHFPAVEIVLRHAVFDRDDRIFADQLGEIIRLLLRRAGLALAFIDVFAVLEEFGGGRIERDHDVAAGLVAGLGDRLHDDVERGFRRFQIGREAALVADIGVEAASI